MLRVPGKTLQILFFSSPLVITVVVFRSYVFTEPFAVFLLLAFVATMLFVPLKTDSLKLAFSFPVFLHVLFILYLLWKVEGDTHIDYGVVYEQSLYLLIFLVSAIYSYNERTNHIISIVALLYIASFVGRVFMDFSATRYGSSLWSGFVLYTLSPLVLMSRSINTRMPAKLEIVFLCFCILFLAALRARVPTVCLGMFLVFLYVLPKMPRALGTALFSGFFIILFGLMFTYINSINTDWGAGIDEISQNYISKPLYTGRELIWKDLIEIVRDNPWTGICSNCPTQEIQGESISRPLSSHNTFLEIAYRTGVLGLMIFAGILFAIWKNIYAMRSDPLVLISASFLISSLLFMSSSVFLFGNMVVINFLAWMIMGLGYGRAVLLKRPDNYEMRSGEMLLMPNASGHLVDKQT